MKESNNRNSCWFLGEKALIQCAILINGMEPFMFLQSHFSTHVPKMSKKGEYMSMPIYVQFFHKIHMQ